MSEQIVTFEEGDRVELVSMTDEFTRMKPGAHGTVTGIDALGTIHIRWDGGSHLGVIPGVDEIRKLLVHEEVAR